MLFQSNPKLTLTRIHSFYTASHPQTPPIILTHDVAIGTDGTPTALPGRFLSEDEINHFHEQVTNAGNQWNLLRKNLIAYRNQSHVWWSPSKKRRMYFKTQSPELNALSGQEFYQPSVLFRNHGETLHAWALPNSRKPSLRTSLCRIPLYNSSNDGLICMPNVKKPYTPESLEEHFWNSPYTHSNSAGKTLYQSPLSYPQFLTTLCTHSFPAETLIPTNLTLEEILR